MRTSREDSSSLRPHFLNADSDVIGYIGPIVRPGYDALCELLAGSPRRKNCLFVLCTYGGFGDAGYRIARALSHHYPDGAKISVLVPGFCKSAGTLVCIGAHELIVADRGELGPLDVQVRKQDEMFQSGSGLDILRGHRYLKESALQTFASYLIEINSDSGLSTKAASEIAGKLAIGLHEPIFAQIDPIRLGEMQAALTIALEYGDRLDARTGNLFPHSLLKLANGYPSHDFVIDRKEARSLFKNVRQPNVFEDILCEHMRAYFARRGSGPSPTVLDLLQSIEDDESTDAGWEEVLDGTPKAESKANSEPSDHTRTTEEAEPADAGQLGD